VEQLAGVFVFQLVETAFPATIAQRFPFNLGQVGKGGDFPKNFTPSPSDGQGR
jgi:hypothetical protein